MGRVRLERQDIDKKREQYIKELTSAREKLSWDNFSSVPIEKTTQIKKMYKEGNLGTEMSFLQLI